MNAEPSITANAMAQLDWELAAPLSRQSAS